MTLRHGASNLRTLMRVKMVEVGTELPDIGKRSKIITKIYITIYSVTGRVGKVERRKKQKRMRRKLKINTESLRILVDHKTWIYCLQPTSTKRMLENYLKIVVL
jgi:hypothetical protein